MSIDKEFVPYKLALELKELGFDEPCFGWFTGSYLRIGSVVENKHVQGEDEILAPTYSQAFRFFRDKGYSFNIVGYRSILRNFYSIEIWDGKKLSFDLDSIFDSYEEVELELLKKLIEIVKNK